jgi:hypothetical protein
LNAFFLAVTFAVNTRGSLLWKTPAGPGIRPGDKRAPGTGIIPLTAPAEMPLMIFSDMNSTLMMLGSTPTMIAGEQDVVVGVERVFKAHDAQLQRLCVS